MNDLLRDPFKAGLVFTIVGLILLPYSLFASRTPARLFKDPATPKQKQFVRIGGALLGAFMVLRGAWLLLKAFGYFA